MKITYDPDGEMLYIKFTDQFAVRADEKAAPGMVIMFDAAGKVCAIEIEDATQLVTEPNRVDFVYYSVPEDTAEQKETV